MPAFDEIETVGDIVRAYGRDRPDKTAIVFEGERLSYAELDRRSSRVANTLIAAGLKPGGRVAHLGKNTLAYFELLFGVAKAGGVMVGINWRLAPPEVRFILEDADAHILFADEALFSVADEALKGRGGIEQAIALDGDHAGWLAFADWRDAADDADPRVAVDPGDVVFQMYTSGTTGHPKGAEITHFAAVAPRGRDHMIAEGEGWHRWTGEEVQLVQAPVFHLTGNVWALIGLAAGAALVVHQEFDIARILADIEGEGITHAIFVPAMMLAILQHPRAAETDYSRLKTIYYGASPIPLDLLRKAVAVFGADFIQLYGMTEIGGSATWLPPGAHDPAGENPRMRSAGKPFPWAEIKIVGPQGEALPPGAVGEVAIRIDTLMRGYWKRPEATEQSIREGWFFTGDAGYLDSDGFVYIHDRVKDMIISGGENIYPAEVESALFGHPAVKDVAVIGVPSEKWGEEVKAVVVAKPGAEVGEADLIAYARERIAGYKCPKSVDFVEALPRNATGKLLKRELRKPYREAAERKAG